MKIFDMTKLTCETRILTNIKTIFEFDEIPAEKVEFWILFFKIIHKHFSSSD